MIILTIDINLIKKTSNKNESEKDGFNTRTSTHYIPMAVSRLPKFIFNIVGLSSNDIANRNYQKQKLRMRYKNN